MLTARYHLELALYLGGSADDQGRGIALDSMGNAYVTGVTTSSGFPTTLGAFRTAFGGSEDAFVTKAPGVVGKSAEKVRPVT